MYKRQALGYPRPKSFKKTQPRFVGQDFDTYVQKSDNLQIWNEGISPNRRYVLIRIDESGVLTRVRVLTGISLQKFDTTGTLTTKYQASSISKVEDSMLVSEIDTDSFLKSGEEFLPIKSVFEKLKASVVGRSFADPGGDQERNRGGELHSLACKALGCDMADDGQFPDIVEQMLEVKLQTSPTIDLGLVCPNSTDAVNGASKIRHCDCLLYTSPSPRD